MVFVFVDCILSISLAHIDFGVFLFLHNIHFHTNVAQHGERLSIVRLWWVAGIFVIYDSNDG